METSHRIVYADAARLDLPDASVALVVTSPPYPMIAMWDEGFAKKDKAIATALATHRGMDAFERMHRLLDPVWEQVYRVLVPGGIACINIGDATRTVGDTFALYPNHVRILSKALSLGFVALPLILWRKTTNAPNKFMGSGMLAPGAYVTLEHEYILVLRKGDKRLFSPDQAQWRRQSAYFWEERNQWFSDVWFNLIGARQEITDSQARKRSAAFPFEVPYRLITMFSIKGDTVLDPFAGTGTTCWAAMACGRNSIGYEAEKGLKPLLRPDPARLAAMANAKIAQRLADHQAFVAERGGNGKPLKHANRWYGFAVITNQEKELFLNEVVTAEWTRSGLLRATYQPAAQTAPAAPPPAPGNGPGRPVQLEMFT